MSCFKIPKRYDKLLSLVTKDEIEKDDNLKQVLQNKSKTENLILKDIFYINNKELETNHV